GRAVDLELRAVTNVHGLADPAISIAFAYYDAAFSIEVLILYRCNLCHWLRPFLCCFSRLRMDTTHTAGNRCKTPRRLLPVRPTPDQIAIASASVSWLPSPLPSGSTLRRPERSRHPGRTCFSGPRPRCPAL